MLNDILLVLKTVFIETPGKILTETPIGKIICGFIAIGLVIRMAIKKGRG